jgi:hypothetical protein
MEELVGREKAQETTSEIGEYNDKYHSVEFAISGASVLHQFKIWNIPPTSMCLLVKKDSYLLRSLKVGDKLNMKYYPAESGHPPDFFETAIRDIVENDQTRFKNHFLVGLEILESQD